jgi:putative membrane protein
VKFIGRLCLGVVAVIVVVFSLANRDIVTVSLWPLPFEVPMPLYLAMLGPLVIGLLAGGTVSWFGKLRLRWRARASEKRAAAAERAATASATAASAAAAGGASAGALPPPRYRPALSDD